MRSVAEEHSLFLCIKCFFLVMIVSVLVVADHAVSLKDLPLTPLTVCVCV